MKLGNVETHLHMMRRIGLPILLTLFLLAKRGVTAVHYSKKTHEMVRPPMPLPVFGLAVAAPIGVGAWLYAFHATNIPLLAFETGMLAACITLMTAIAAYEGQQLRALLKQGGHVADWWRPEQLG